MVRAEATQVPTLEATTADDGAEPITVIGWVGSRPCVALAHIVLQSMHSGPFSSAKRTTPKVA